MQNTATILNLSDTQPVPARVEKRLPNLISRKLKPINQSIFKNIHNNNLIYNTCWEDPRCDRTLLELNRESRVVMITSAGCNALDYALDRPTEIHCIDMNSRQNALLDLKISAIQHTDAQNLFQLFGQGGYDDAENLYHTILRPTLPNYARRYWDKNIGFFVPKGIRKSFYWHSTSGLVAWFFTTYLKAQGKTYRIAEQLFAAKNLVEQSELYGQLEKEMMTNFVKWLMSQHLFMCFLGVPQSQQQLLSVAQNDSKTKNTDLPRDHREGVLVAFIQRSLRQVFTKLPISDNYFWQLYFNGKYTPDCCPNYLKPENHAVLRKETTKIRTYTTTITSFLEQNPASYSHYVLLDHQDWLAANDRAALAEEWQAILKNSHSGTRILLRSAANTVDFFPDFIHKHIVFEKEKTAEMHKIDRVGTYGSVYLGIVK